jgi:hypothetical protein
MSVGAAALLTYYASRSTRGPTSIAQPPSVLIQPTRDGKSAKLVDPITGKEGRVDRGQTENNLEFEKRILAEKERLEKERARLTQEQEKKAPPKYLFLDKELSLRGLQEQGIYKDYFGKSMEDMKYDLEKIQPYDSQNVKPGSLVLIERENNSGAKEQVYALYTPNGSYHVLYPKDSNRRWMRDATNHTGYSSPTLNKYLEETKGTIIGVFIPQNL